jgi:hypothetical protein
VSSSPLTALLQVRHNPFAFTAGDVELGFASAVCHKRATKEPLRAKTAFERKKEPLRAGLCVRGVPQKSQPKPEARNPKPETRSPKPEARNPKPEARSPKPETLNPKEPLRANDPVPRKGTDTCFWLAAP